MRGYFPTFGVGASFIGSRLARHGLLALSVWVILNMADAFITWRSFGIGAVEFNPLLLTLQNAAGPQLMLLGKAILAVSAGVLLWWWGRKRVLRAVNWLMTGVVTYNVAVVGYLLVR